MEILKETKMALMPPAPGKCPICAVEHNPEWPHDKNSLYYQIRFHSEHGRYPTWQDAMAHCPGDIKRDCIDALKEHAASVKKESAPKEIADLRDANKNHAPK